MHRRSIHGQRYVLWCSAAECGVGFVHPQPTPEELADLYQSAYYQPGSCNEANKYSNTPEQVAQQLAATLTGQIGPLTGRRLLDFGAGVGGFAALARSLGAEVDCIEPDAEARRQAERRGLVSYPDLEALGNAKPANRYDVITSIEVIEHLRDPVRDFHAFRRLLAPRGALFLTTPNFASLRARIEGLRWEQYRNPTHLFYFEAVSLKRALKEAGFRKVVRLRTRVVYPAHGPLRRLLQLGLRRTSLDGDLVMLALSD